MSSAAADQVWLERIHALELPDRVRILNVCGADQHATATSGQRAVLPSNVELIPGPARLLCICPEEDVHLAIRIALDADVTLVTFADMLRATVNLPQGEIRSLREAAAAGADIRSIASAAEAVACARADPGRRVVFFAAGFETSTAPVAAMLAEGAPANLLVLLSGRLTWPAVAMLLESGDAGFDALIAPGHVATMMGPEEWAFVPERFRIPAAIAGFSPATLLPATYSVLRQSIEGRCILDNCYGDAVRTGGNPAARAYLNEVMQIADANWRGIGVIARSGFVLRKRYAAYDARVQLLH